jgi:hypothetical protein
MILTFAAMKILFSFCFVFIVFSAEVYAQVRVTTFGLQVKPMIPSRFNPRSVETEFKNNVEYSLSKLPGYSFGMVIRRGYTENFSFEGGINSVTRNFSLVIQDNDKNQRIERDFRIVAYEIPLLMLVFIRLSEEIYMNAALGGSFDFFPSEVGIKGDGYQTLSRRNSWAQAAILANVGWEYRTQKSGYFYIGGSFHRPFTAMYTTGVLYERDQTYDNVYLKMTGNYITLDLRYFFHEDPEPKKRRIKKSESIYYRPKTAPAKP